MSDSAVLGSVPGCLWSNQAGLAGKAILLKSFSYFDVKWRHDRDNKTLLWMCNFSHYNKCIENLRFNTFRQIQQVICFWLLVYNFFFVIYSLIHFWNPIQMDDFIACLFLCANQWGLQNRNRKRFFIFHWVFVSYHIKFTMKNHNQP